MATWIQLIVLSAVQVALVANAPPMVTLTFLPVAAIILYNRIELVENRKEVRLC